MPPIALLERPLEGGSVWEGVGGEFDVVVLEVLDVVRVVGLGEVVGKNTFVVILVELYCKFCNRKRVVPQKKVEFGKVLHN